MGATSSSSRLQGPFPATYTLCREAGQGLGEMEENWARPGGWRGNTGRRPKLGQRKEQAEKGDRNSRGWGTNSVTREDKREQCLARMVVAKPVGSEITGTAPSPAQPHAPSSPFSLRHLSPTSLSFHHRARHPSGPLCSCTCHRPGREPFSRTLMRVLLLECQVVLAERLPA